MYPLSRTCASLDYRHFLHHLLIIDINLFKRLLVVDLRHIPRQICSQRSNMQCLLKLWIINDWIRIRIKLILKAWFIRLVNIRFYFLDVLNPSFPDRVPFSYSCHLNCCLLLILNHRFLLLSPRGLPVSRIDIYRVMFVTKIMLMLPRLFHRAFIGHAFKVIHALHRGEILSIDRNVLLVVARWQYSQFSLRHDYALMIYYFFLND